METNFFFYKLEEGWEKIAVNVISKNKKNKNTKNTDDYGSTVTIATGTPT
jgi:hypothetical protein